MPKKAPVADRIYLDETEGFLLEHALLSPPRTWPPVAPEPTQSQRVASTKRKMDWEGKARSLDLSADGAEVTRKERQGDEDSEAGDGERCVICLMGLRDRTIVGVCGHEFCFSCIGVWSNQSRRCPLCSADMAPFLLHDLDNKVPTKFYLPPLPTKRPHAATAIAGPSRLPLPEERPRPDEVIEEDQLAVQIERRREIYQQGLFAKHIGSNKHTGFRANPTPRQIADDPALIRRATAFLRRELRVWSSSETESLATYILSLLKSFDLRSDPAVRLISEVLEPTDGAASIPNGAEHLAHELYSYLRSPYNDLWRWDDIVQYGTLSADEETQVTETRERSRSRSASPPRSPSPSPSRSRPRSWSRSLSPRSYSSYSSFSRSPSPRSPRETRKRDYADRRRSPSPLPRRRPGEADTWIDPEYAAWLEEEKKRAQERRQRRRRGPSPPAKSKKPVELLPVDPLADNRMRMDEVVPPLSIKGAARSSLLERLAKAKAETAQAGTSTAKASTGPEPTALADEVSADSPLISATAMSKPGVRAAVQARLRLRLKLASEKKTLIFNQNESRAQLLRAQILEAKARREAEETDAVLRTMDRMERAREVRRRLMVLKILAAETEAEKKARELKERLVNTKRAKALREQLLQRKRSASGQAAEGIGAEVATGA